MRWDVDAMLLVTCPSLTGWHWCVWVERRSTWGPVRLPRCGEARYQGVSWTAHACAEDSMRLRDPITHWPAKLPEVDATWCIPVVLLWLAWCLTGGGRVSSWCWGRAGMFPAAGWWFGKVGAGSYCISGAWKSSPFGEGGSPQSDAWWLENRVKDCIPGEWGRG